MSIIQTLNKRSGFFANYLETFVDSTGIVTPPTTVNFEHNISITDTEVIYSFVNTTQNRTIFNIKLELPTLLSNNRCFDQSIFMIQNNGLSGDNTPNPQQSTINNTQLHSRLDFMSINKAVNVIVDKPAVPISKVEFLPFRIFVPSASITSFNQCVFLLEVPAVVTANDPSTITCTINSGSIVPVPSVPWKDLFYPITATTTQTTVNSGDVITVNVSTDPSISALYLDQVTGILDRTKVKLTNGHGVFKILTSTLVTGDIAEVKVGYKTFSNQVTFTKTIS
jgi:hypothetical protein